LRHVTSSLDHEKAEPLIVLLAMHHKHLMQRSHFKYSGL